jgi:lysozyme family protein
MTADFAISAIIAIEGGYVCNPNDPGGETKFGISKRTFPDLAIKELTEADAKRIYLDQYWLPNRCEEMPHGLDLLYFDCCVNQGPRAAVIVLDRALSHAPGNLIASGALRDSMIADAQKRDRLELIDQFAAERAHWYAHTNRFENFGRGWMRRLFKIHRLAVSA